MGKLIMSKKEIQLIPVLEKLLKKMISQKVAGKMLGITDRQIKNTGLTK